MNARVIIATPSGDTVQADYAFSLANLFAKSVTRPQGVLNFRSSVLPHARNECVHIARQAKATHIFFIDSDLHFPPDSLDRLLAHNKSFVTASYARKNDLREPVGEPLYPNEQMRPLRRMKSGAMGFALIDLSVFDTLPQPWYAFRYVDNISGAQGRGCFRDEGYYMCDTCHEHNIAIWEDTVLSRELAHVGNKQYKL